MFATRAGNLRGLAVSTLLLGFFASAAVSAAPVTYTFDFAGAYTNAPSGAAGNEFIFADGTLTATVTSWAEIGAGTLEEATGHQMANGMGVCNSLETKCLEKENIRGITEAVGKDWILVTFSEIVNLSSFTVSPETGDKVKAQFRDVTYYTGSLASPGDLNGKTYADLTGALGLTEGTLISGKGLDDVTVNIAPDLWGNSIIIGGTIGGAGDRILLNGMTTVVPIPASIWLFLTALGVLAGNRKKTG